MVRGLLTKRELTLAIRAYARKHGYFARTVRTITALLRAAITEYSERLERNPEVAVRAGA